MPVSRTLMLFAIGLAATVPAIAKDKKPVDPNKKVCRTDVATGSRLPKSTCHTNAEWAQIDQENAAGAQSVDLRARSGVSGQ